MALDLDIDFCELPIVNPPEESREEIWLLLCLMEKQNPHLRLFGSFGIPFGHFLWANVSSLLVNLVSGAFHEQQERAIYFP